MKRIGILSDTHGYLEVIDKILARTAREKLDFWFHAGDYGDDAWYMATKTDIPIIAVRGNNDRVQPLEVEEQLYPCEDTFIYMVHGHRLPTYNRMEELLFLAKCMDAKLVISGHSHHHGSYQHNGVLWVNPGSPSLPRDGSSGTFAIATYEEGKFTVEFVYLDEH